MGCGKLGFRKREGQRAMASLASGQTVTYARGKCPVDGGLAVIVEMRVCLVDILPEHWSSDSPPLPKHDEKHARGCFFHSNEGSKNG